jgi:hypothetical protein
MEEQLGCQFKGMYSESLFNEEDTAKIAEGQYPLILAKDGVFTKLYVSDAELDNYGIFDALQTDVNAQNELHGPKVPIVWVKAEDGGMHETGFDRQIREESAE